MQKKSRSIVIITILFAYIIAQFLWWEILLVKQTSTIIDGKQTIAALNSTDQWALKHQIEKLQHEKRMRAYMIVGEGTVFLLLLLVGVIKVKQYHERETELANQQKNFLLSITHELKTPIAATKLQLQTIQKHQLDKEKEKELIGNALRETERLNKLIDNVLLASRFDNNQIILDKEKINISKLTENSLHTYFNDRIMKREVKCDIEENIYLDTDKVIFPSLIINLLENAIKYSFEKIEATISLKQQNGQIIMQVCDQGLGIPDREKPLVFDRFYRVGSEEIRSTIGTGIGLYIVKQIVDAHKGNIRIKNNTPKGTIFEITFHA
jgi:two-component system phosphate regulon sensor histidine kinase PhoR